MRAPAKPTITDQVFRQRSYTFRSRTSVWLWFAVILAFTCGRSRTSVWLWFAVILAFTCGRSHTSV